MTEELEQLLKNLKLKRMLSVYDEQLHAAEKQDVTYSDFIAGLLRAQWHHRQESSLEWRIKQANLPERWSLETFPWQRQPGVNRKQIRAFGELDFIAKHENLVFVGPTGMGKTGLASGILLKALQNGYRCQFIRAQDLFDEMYASLADRSTRQLLNRLGRLDVLLSQSGRVKTLALQATASARAPRDNLDGCRNTDAARILYSKSICTWCGSRSIADLH
jgi:DNA replication protein DnaC